MTRPHVYIASALERAAEVAALRDMLAEHGIGLSYDWTQHGSVQAAGYERIAEVARAELEGVARADLVIVWLPGGRGTHAELGIALGLNAARSWRDPRTVSSGLPTVPILLVGPREGDDGRECAFYHAPGVMHYLGEDGEKPGDVRSIAAFVAGLLATRTFLTGETS